jgi:hypothetical protein
MSRKKVNCEKAEIEKHLEGRFDSVMDIEILWDLFVKPFSQIN